MLKKLVKYGNSNALVLDKPILELLGIEEGSIVRLKTDGASLMITPHVKPVAEPVTESVNIPVDQNEVFMRANLETGMAQNAHLYKHLSAEEQKQFVEDSVQNYREVTSATTELTQNPDIYQNYRAELGQLLASKPDATLAERQAIFYKYSPKMRIAQQKALDITAKYKIPGYEAQLLSSDRYKAMQADFSNLFTQVFKDSNNCALPAENLNSPEYLHEMQLLAENHKAGNLTSEQYAEASRETMYKYMPKLRAIHAETQAIAAKFQVNKNK